jgi:sugar phosphate isomerase/epimerase
MQFGVSTHLFHGERLGPAHLETLAAHGFTLVEIFATRTHVDYHDARRIDELAGWLAACGMTAGSLHAPICDGFRNGTWGRAFSNASGQSAGRLEAVDETRKALEAARRLGCPTVVLHLGLPRGQTIPAGDNDPASMRRSLEVLAEAAEAAGVRLALEVMPNALSTPEALLDAIEALDLGPTGVCLDVGHAHLMGGAPEAAELLSGHVIATHLHDNAGTEDDHLAPFEGTIDWAATLMALGKIGYGGPLVFEVAGRGDALGTLSRTVGARARLQGILDELSAPLPFDDPHA